MSTDLATRIETYLLLQHRWVGAEELCRVFAVRERQLRSTETTPGLCSDFAISGNNGYKHFRCANDEEFDRFRARINSHTWRQSARLQRMIEAREAARTGEPPYEKFTGQGLLRV